MKIVLLFLTIMLAHISYSQIGIANDDLHSEALLQASTNEKIWILPKVDNVSSITIPSKGMIVYDKSIDGIVGYQQYNSPNLYWSVFYVYDSSFPTNVETTLANYTRTGAANTNNTEYEITDLRTNVTVTKSGKNLVAQLNNTIQFDANCFRGVIKITLETSGGTLIDSNEILFNYAGINGATTEMPFQITLLSVINNPGDYVVKVFQNPTFTICKTEGSFIDNRLTISHY